MQPTPAQVEASIKLATIVVPLAILNWLFVIQGVRKQRFYMMARSRGGFVGPERASLYRFILAINLLGATSLTVIAIDFTLGANQIDGSAYIPHWILVTCGVLVPAAAGASLEDVEKITILKTLDEAGGNKSEAARRLGITRRTLHLKLKKYGLM